MSASNKKRLEKLYAEYGENRDMLRNQDTIAARWLGDLCGILQNTGDLLKRAKFQSDIILTDGNHSDQYDYAERQLVMIMGEARQIYEEPEEDISNTFWKDLHPSVIASSKSRYDSKHYADAVEAALKGLNLQIKEYVVSVGGDELDGARLMRRAFSLNNPLIKLEKLETESERNIQEGYMNLYAGAMIGIRNPKAHENITIDASRCRHMLYFASLLFQVFDERI